MADSYLSNWGNDNNDGLSWETAKRSVQGIRDATLAGGPVHAKGIFNEDSTIRILQGEDGYVIFDGTLKPYFILNLGYNQLLSLSNAIVQNFSDYAQTSNRFYTHYYNCIIRNIPGQFGETIDFQYVRRNLLVYKVGTILLLHQSLADHQNCTYSATSLIRFHIYQFNVLGKHISNIYMSPTYSIEAVFPIRYSMFIGGSFKFIGGGLGTDETVYTDPIGADDAAKMNNIRDRMAIVYGGVANDYLVDCLYYSGSYNDIFVDADNGDFSLVPNCLAAHMNYYGDYVGACKEGVPATWNADWTNIINIDSNGRIIDQNLDASAESVIKDIGHIRLVKDFAILGGLSLRNGQSLNNIPNVGIDIAAGSNVLTAGYVYQVYNNTIVTDDALATTYAPFECFRAVDEGGGAGLGFSGDGVVRRVLIDDYDPKIQIKCSKTDPTLATATLITCKASDNPVFVNVDGAGEPLYGSGDAGYDAGTAVPLSTRYIKFFVQIKAWQLTAR